MSALEAVDDSGGIYNPTLLRNLERIGDDRSDLSRASGFVAYGLLWGAVVLGPLFSTGRRWVRPPHLLDAHQFLSTAAVSFASFHGLVLMGDRYVSFLLRAIVAPFVSSYEPLPVACGQIALWLSVLLIGSFHVRRHIGGRA